MLKRNKNLQFILAAATLLLPTTLSAQLNSPGHFAQESPSMNRSVRALGMGNAFIAVDGNVYSPFYNPAGLNDIEKGRFNILSPTMEVSSSAFGLVSDVRDLVDDIDAANSDSQKVDALDNFVKARFGEFNHLRAALNIINYTRHNFAAGALLEERLTLSFRDQALPKFEVRDITDLVFYASVSHNWWEKLLQAGVTVKPAIRSAVNEAINSATAVNDEVDDVFQTLLFPHLGISFDLGLKSDLSFPGLMKSDSYKRLHEYLKPAVALTWQDIGNTPFKWNLRDTDGNEDGVENPAKFVNAVASSPVDSEQSISVGAKVSPKLAILDTNFALDVRDLNQDKDFFTKLNIGAEVKFPKILALRAGLSQGYLAAGIGVDLWIVNVDFATYAEEVGQFSREDGNRRYALSLNMGI